jgi:hypothetical protein
MKLFYLIAVLALPAAVFAQETIPAGVVIPARLETTLTSTSKLGEKITARIMQDVPLGSGEKIRAGSRLFGHVIKVGPSQSSSGTNLVLVFEKVIASRRTFSVTTSLRSLASPMEVADAQIPSMGPDRGTAQAVYTTLQVGGNDVVYRGGGHVMNASEVVGEPTPDGVIGRARANPQGDCRAEVGGYDQPQAFWVFSTDACGLYGFADLSIVRTGRTEPLGQIELSSSGRMKVWGGSGILLRVITAAAPGT